MRETLHLDVLMFYTSAVLVCCTPDMNLRITHAHTVHIKAQIQIEFFCAHQTAWCSGWIDNQHRHADIDPSDITSVLHSTSNRIQLSVESQAKLSVVGEL